MIYVKSQRDKNSFLASLASPVSQIIQLTSHVTSLKLSLDWQGILNLLRRLVYLIFPFNIVRPELHFCFATFWVKTKVVTFFVETLLPIYYILRQSLLQFGFMLHFALVVTFCSSRRSMPSPVVFNIQRAFNFMVAKLIDFYLHNKPVSASVECSVYFVP